MSTNRNRIVDPVLVINNDVVSYTTGSLSYTLGRGEIKLGAETSGGGNIQIIRGLDVASKFAMIKFDVACSPANVDLFEELLNNQDGFVVTITDGEDVNFTMRKGWITNDIEFKHGPEENFSVEIKGSPMI